MPKPSSLKTKLHRFIEIGAVAPSSRFLARRMVSCITEKENLIVIELGAGTGTITKAILEKLPASGKLFALEIGERSAKVLRQKIKDPRLEVIRGDALELSKHLHTLHIKHADYIISGLPLGNFSAESIKKVLREIRTCLQKDSGMYIQFQYFLASLDPIKKIFPNVSIRFEPRNIPPAFVLTCKQKATRVV